MSPAEGSRCLFRLAREHREARKSARCRGTGASSGTADFDSSGKLSALCVRRGVSYPPYSLRRAPDVPPGGTGEGEGDSVSAPVPPPLTHAGNKRVSRQSLALTSQEPLTFPWRHACDSSLFLSPSPVHPFRPVPTPSRAHAPPRASWQQVLDPAAGLSGIAHGRIPGSGRTIDIDRRAAGETRERGGREGRELGKRNLGPRRDLDYRGLVTWISRKWCLEGADGDYEISEWFCGRGKTPGPFSLGEGAALGRQWNRVFFFFFFRGRTELVWLWLIQWRYRIENFTISSSIYFHLTYSGYTSRKIPIILMVFFLVNSCFRYMMHNAIEITIRRNSLRFWYVKRLRTEYITV